MTSTRFGRRARLVAISCGLGASAPIAALAQAQSPNCAKASLYHSTHDKRAAEFDRLCAGEHAAAQRPQASNNQGAANQAAQRAAMLEQRRQQALEQRRQQQAQEQQQQRLQMQQQRQQQQQQQRQQPSSGGSSLADFIQQRRLAQQQRQQQYQQNQGGYMPAAAPAPAPAPTGYGYGMAPAPAAAPAPSAPPPSGAAAPTQASLVSDSAAADPSGVAALLTPGPRNPSLVSDQSNAKKAKADLTVFNLGLGEPVTRPRCAELATRGSDSCVSEAAGVPVLVAAMFNQRVSKLSGFNNVPVQLPDSQCPDWLRAGSCTVVLAVKDGYPYAAFMVTGGEAQQSTIETLLNQKYGKSADKSQPAACKSANTAQPTPLRVWAMRGLRVEYDPLGTGCRYPRWRYGSGQLVVETDTFRKLTKDAEQARDAGPAKM